MSDARNKDSLKLSTTVPKFDFMHVMLRVLDLDCALDFYVRILRMRVLRRRDAPEGRYTNVFVGYQPEDAGTVIELTHNWDQNELYEAGSSYGHLALGVSDIYAACDELAKEGVAITRPPGPVKFGSTVVAFIEDPDGHKIELIERSRSVEAVTR